MRNGICAAFAAALVMTFHPSMPAANPVSPGNITEYSVDPDWIEVDSSYWYRFSNPFLVDGNEVKIFWDKVQFVNGTYVVFDSTNTSGFDLKPEGGTISFPILGYPLEYGPGKKYPTPPAGESVVLFEEWDSVMRRYTHTIDPTPTRGTRNDAPVPLYGSGTVCINEVISGGGANPAFVELYNRADTAADIGGYSVVSGARYRIPTGTTIPAHGFFVLPEQAFPEGFALPSGGGTVFLQNGKFELVDQMGWPGGLDSGISVNRIPDGLATVFQGYDYATSIDFREGGATPGTTNSGLPIVSIAIEDDRTLLFPGAKKRYFCRGVNTVGRLARIPAGWSITDIGTVDQDGMIVGVRCGNGILTARYETLSDTLHVRGAVGGVVANDMVWKKEFSPYYVEGNAHVWYDNERKSSLRIEPGVEVRFMGDYQLAVSGTLTAQGTADEPIIFTWRREPDHTPSGGLWLQDPINTLSHCVFDSAGSAVSISGFGSSADISNCIFRYNRKTVTIDGNSRVGVTDCLFQSNELGIGMYSDASVSGCVFRDNTVNLRIQGKSSVTRNLFFHAPPRQKGSGIEVSQARGEIKLVNNTISGWETGITVAEWPGTLIRNTIFSDCAVGIDGLADISYNCFCTTNPVRNGPEGIGIFSAVNARGTPCDRYFNILIDPGFVDAAREDFRLAAGSPCIDAGDSLILDMDRTVSDMGMYGGGGGTLSGVGDALANTRPSTLRIERNYPNPFNPSTTIVFTLPGEGPASLAVYNIVGGKVRDLVSGRLTAGRHEARWDGRDDRGNTLSSGVYLIRLSQGRAIDTRKLLLMK